MRIQRLVWKAGDSQPPIQLEIDGRPLNLTGVRAAYTYRRQRDGRIINRPLRILDAPGGLLRPPTNNPPLDTPLQLELCFPGGMVYSPPDWEMLVQR